MEIGQAAVQYLFLSWKAQQKVSKKGHGLFFRKMALTEGGSFLVSSILSLLIFSAMQVVNCKNVRRWQSCSGVQGLPGLLPADDDRHRVHRVPALCLPHHCRCNFLIDVTDLDFHPTSWEFGEDRVWQQLSNKIGRGKICEYWRALIGFKVQINISLFCLI